MLFLIYFCYSICFNFLILIYFFKEILVQDHFFRKYSVNHIGIFELDFHVFHLWWWNFWNQFCFHFQVQKEIEREFEKTSFSFVYQWNDVLSPTLLLKCSWIKRFDDRAIIFDTQLLLTVIFDKFIKDFLWLLFFAN